MMPGDKYPGRASTSLEKLRPLRQNPGSAPRPKFSQTLSALPSQLRHLLPDLHAKFSKFAWESTDPLQQVFSPIANISCNDLQSHDLLGGVYWPNRDAGHDSSVMISTTEKDLVGAGCFSNSS